LSTTQVRKGVYKDSLEAWKRYETKLTPLVKLIGKRTRWDLKTTLLRYIPPSLEDNQDDTKSDEDAQGLPRTDYGVLHDPESVQGYKHEHKEL
jgi:hypothetical protein